ncbi:YbjQ family protein [Cereibacter sphaeroides]|uniref:YbjQ family protein n=1 Tax=Cereibacter sphaeroides TaxID=1063 RepID=UPI0015FDB582|nr:YbjQ family protein [Cereibacter sphaeroides]
MPVCKTCGHKTGFLDIVDGQCRRCRQESLEDGQRASAQEAAARKKQRDAIIVTTETAPNLPVNQRLGIVSSERVFGLNAFKDMFVAVRDLAGGKSVTLEKAFQDARRDALEDIKTRASELGADAVIAISFTHSQIAAGAIHSSMVMVVATGTAVTLAPGPAASAP